MLKILNLRTRSLTSPGLKSTTSRCLRWDNCDSWDNWVNGTIGTIGAYLAQKITILWIIFSYRDNFFIRRSWNCVSKQNAISAGEVFLSNGVEILNSWKKICEIKSYAKTNPKKILPWLLCPHQKEVSPPRGQWDPLWERKAREEGRAAVDGDLQRQTRWWWWWW